MLLERRAQMTAICTHFSVDKFGTGWPWSCKFMPNSVLKIFPALCNIFSSQQTFFHCILEWLWSSALSTSESRSVYFLFRHIVFRFWTAAFSFSRQGKGTQDSWIIYLQAREYKIACERTASRVGIKSYGKEVMNHSLRENVITGPHFLVFQKCNVI